MKLRELERHLRAHGCILFREGGAHTVAQPFQPENRQRAATP
jgi:hypothetical protein